MVVSGKFRFSASILEPFRKEPQPVWHVGALEMGFSLGGSYPVCWYSHLRDGVLTNMFVPEGWSSHPVCSYLRLRDGVLTQYVGT